MRPRDMHKMAHKGCHTCAPKPWRAVPNVTGDYDLDATIMHRRNRDLPGKLNMHLAQPRVVAGAYGPSSGYSGYRGGHGGD